MRPVVLDTDIGSDVDDVLALVMLGKAPEVQLLGITTVYGDTSLRAKIARVTCNMLDQFKVAVIPGAPNPISQRQVFWAGHEGENVPGLDAIAVDHSKKAEVYLVETANQLAGKLEILAIGPLTNIANAIRRSGAFVKNVKRLFLMGGAYWQDRPEHNIRCDIDAAEIVFASGIPITAIGLDVTTRVWMVEKDVARIAVLSNGLGTMLEKQIRSWWTYRNSKRNHPHDPVAALSMVKPDLFRFENCDVKISRSEQEFAFTKVQNCGQGSIRIASDVFGLIAQREIVRRIAT